MDRRKFFGSAIGALAVLPGLGWLKPADDTPNLIDYVSHVFPGFSVRWSDMAFDPKTQSWTFKKVYERVWLKRERQDSHLRQMQIAGLKYSKPQLAYLNGVAYMVNVPKGVRTVTTKTATRDREAEVLELNFVAKKVV